MRSPDGFEAFFQEQYDGIVRSLTLVFGDRAAAEDAAQVGFEKAFVRWRRVSAMSRPGTWVYVVAVRHGRRLLGSDEPEIDAPVGADPVQEVDDRLAVMDLVAQLPPRQRAVVVLRYLEDLTLEEIARSLGMRVGTVKSTLHAAQGRLRIETNAQEALDAR